MPAACLLAESGSRLTGIAERSQGIMGSAVNPLGQTKQSVFSQPEHALCGSDAGERAGHADGDEPGQDGAPAVLPGLPPASPDR